MDNLINVDLPDKDEIKEMGPEELEDLLKYLKELNHSLGNGTLERVKNCTKVCKDMIKLAGELDADLKR